MTHAAAPLQRGWMLACKDTGRDYGLWFIFHSAPDGILAFDLTTKHPHQTYAPFEQALSHMMPPNDFEKIILHGGSIQSKDGLTILHQTTIDNKDSFVINDDFSFQPYRLNLVPGMPPEIRTQENAPTKVNLKPETDFLVILGLRLWETETITAEIKSGLWAILPATKDIVFHTNHEKRLERALNSIN